jgi:hydroxymethylpyrimidine kinase/phosphomethylpyrimidine kinase/thiamine-phosphate diphosphorylase
MTVVWSIAGSDSGGGAGLQADQRALDAFDLHACTAVAAITAQNSVAVERVQAVETGWLDAQLAALASDLRPAAIKTGLLGSAANVRCVAAWVDRLRRDGPVALVVDPVWRASTGADLGEAVREAWVHELLPRATVVTPNRAEAAWLLGWPTDRTACAEGVVAAARALCLLGARAAVVTGGDAGGDRSLDWIDTPETRGWLALPRSANPHHHGSGCVFAASLAGALALEFCIADAAVLAKMAATEAVRAGFAAGRGAGAVRPRRGFALGRGAMPTLHQDPAHAPSAFERLVAPRLGLYPIVDSAEWVARVLAAGARTVQLRIKRGEGDHLSDEVRRSVGSARAAGAQLFINDHWELAIAHGAYGVHLGQEDLATADLPALRRAGLRLGLSTHCFWEVSRALAWRPSYVACGPVHATTTKAMPWRPQGAGNLAYWCRVLEEPVVAIGGMDLARSREAAACGAAGVAVLRGIAQAADPERQMAALGAVVSAGWAAPRREAPSLPRSTVVG